MERLVQPEQLDELPANDPRAIRSRRDLRCINMWMDNADILAGLLRPFAEPQRLTDLGTGDGSLTRRVLAKLGWEKCEVVLLDRQPVAAGVTHADVFDWLDRHESEIIIANLFLHHFDGELPRLLSQIARRSRLFVACEPRRSIVSLAGVKLLPLIACNAVTRHDARLSVRAGFAGTELSQLWPTGWELREFPARLFSHAFVARRR